MSRERGAIDDDQRAVGVELVAGKRPGTGDHAELVPHSVLRLRRSGATCDRVGRCRRRALVRHRLTGARRGAGVAMATTG